MRVLFLFIKNICLSLPVTNMKNFIRQLSSIGVVPSMDFNTQRRVRTLNVFNLIVIFFLLLGTSNALFLKSEYPVLPEVAFLLTAAFSLYLNHRQKYSWSLFAFTFYINASLFFINEYYPFDAGAYLFYFPLVVTIILLNNPSAKDKFTFVHLAISIVFFMVSVLFDFPSIRNNNIPPDTLLVLWYYDVIFSIICTAVLTYMLNQLIYSQNQEILSLLETEKNAQAILSQNLKEKEILFAEVHHRVKNNMAVITALLNLQAEATENPEAKHLISESRNRIMSMSLVHSMLYRTKDLNKIKLNEYISSLCKELLSGYDEKGHIKFTERYDAIELDIDKAIPVGLIINEAITNSIKHAFGRNNHQSEIRLNVSLANNKLTIDISDNGAGFGNRIPFQKNERSLGISLIQSLSLQLDGSVNFVNDNGAKITLAFDHT